MTDSDREQAAQGALLLHRLIPAPDHGAGWKRDPETGFVYYSSEWLSDDAGPRILDEPPGEVVPADLPVMDAKAPE